MNSITFPNAESLPALPAPTIEDVRRAFAYKPFTYTELKDAIVYHRVSFGWSGWLLVIGAPNDASYEWVACEDARGVNDTERRWQRSDAGYGCCATALRDGLVTMLED